MHTCETSEYEHNDNSSAGHQFSSFYDSYDQLKNAIVLHLFLLYVVVLLILMFQAIELKFQKIKTFCKYTMQILAISYPGHIESKA